MAKRLVCVVEGKGEVEAVPVLCARIVFVHLGAPRSEWAVDADPIRLPRSQLVDERVARGARPPRAEGLARASGLIRGRGAHAALVLVDSDGDCPASWGPAARLSSGHSAVMAVREYEAWLLAGHSRVDDADTVRNPKAVAAREWPGYRPTTRQAELTRSMDLSAAEQRSASFRYLVRELRRLVGG
ncbi:MAG: hypothetical protein ABMA64_12560 [Myxococcota bacterium]